MKYYGLNVVCPQEFMYWKLGTWYGTIEVVELSEVEPSGKSLGLLPSKEQIVMRVSPICQ